MTTSPTTTGITITYAIAATGADALARAMDICVEQTVEFPPALVPDALRQAVVGGIHSLRPLGLGSTEAVISFPVDTVGGELTQFLNVLFGNISLKPGLRVERIDLPPAFLATFRGPRFGGAGLRSLVGAGERPLLCTALKPMGLSAGDLADLAYRFALGGIDLIKDDHGLADQRFAPFDERVVRCAEAVARANNETGYRCLYLPNVSAPADRLVDRARAAKRAGAGGLLVAPGLVGWDGMRLLAEDDDLGLPILCHPALLGSFVAAPDSGLSHHVLFGQLPRLAGADASIFPNWGGRFSFSREACRSIAAGAAAAMGPLRPLLPAPGGGMGLDRIPEMLEDYGNDVILLIGGALHESGAGIVDSCRRFRELTSECRSFPATRP
ncbi:MAG: RuBisCO large subunit C-terminal-like domain-containing protein [Alphaproteobacteria bacterium]